MKKTLILNLIIISCLLLVGCNKDKAPFLLEDKYYSSSSYNELDINTFNNLIEEKETFAIFIYQPLCSASYEFNKVLTEFAKKYQINFYKMSFSDMKKTEMGEKVKYYPSLVIYHNGKIVDYLDANSDEDSDYYKSVDSFKEWFSDYIILKEEKNSYYDVEEEKDIEKLKIEVEIDNLVYDENKVNIYMFWGNGCPHCEEQFKFLTSIENEYGDYFTLNAFEVWYDENNEKLMEQFASNMGDEVSGVPYTIIGNKTFTGFGASSESEFLEAIKTQYKNSYDVYFENK